MKMKSNQPSAVPSRAEPSRAEHMVKEEGIHPKRSGSVKCELCLIFCRMLKSNLAQIRQLPLFGCMGLGPTGMILQLLCHSSN